MSVKPCPICRGKQWNHPLTRLINQPCNFCGGAGQVDTDVVCNCGRPAVVKVKDTFVCTRLECQKEVVEGKT